MAKKTKAGAKKQYKHIYPQNSTELSLTSELTEELKDAWVKFRKEASAIGPQRIYAGGWAIMFARKVCYAFVRPKKSYLELVIYMPREVKHPLAKSKASSKTKFATTIKLVHADQVEEPITDWLREAYDFAPV